MNVSYNKIRTSAFLTLFGVMLAGTFSPPAFGQDPRLDIKNLEALSKKASEVVDVNLDGPLLKLASRFMTDEDDREGLEVIKNLKGIYVKSFTFDKPGDYSVEDVEAIRSQLHAPAWSRIVTARDKREGEITEIYLMTERDGGNILGMAIIDAEPTELTVVNIVGPVDIDKLSQLEGKMGIPRLGDQTKEQKPAGHHEKP
ncbi:MAG TPA: DUF4252 domain-containing protein [Terriglobia bacterium]|nr:DUF4252 domain-containing protein [Terriglobia bacterium]